MRNFCAPALTFIVCFSLAGASSAEEIDRLLAAVNGKVITEGDLKMARSLYALVLLGKTETNQSREQELNGLIDLELYRQEMESFPIGQADTDTIQADVQARLDDLRSAYAEIGGLPALLSQLGIQEGELVSYLRLQALMKRFIELRFLPFVNASDKEEVLEQKINAAMDQWIQNIRKHSRIELFDGPSSSNTRKRP